MREIIKTMILDFQELILQIGVPRQLQIKPVSGKATICIGVRRSGKSTYLFQIMQRLLHEGIAHQNFLYINFFDDRLHNLPQIGLGIILEAYYSLYPEKKNTEKLYCFFDEIQVIPGWEPFIDRLLRTENCEVYITGSSAQMLSKEMATQMRGRALSWEIFPFSFREYLTYQKIEATTSLSTKKQLLIQKAFTEYWEKGGFPEVLGLDRFLRIKIHQEYLNAILFRDLIERHNIAHPKAVIDLTYFLLDNTASLYSINRLSGYLKSLGHPASKSSITDYLEWFEDAYFLFTVRVFDASWTRSNANPKKIYCIDHSLVTSVSSGIMHNSGRLLENLVFTTLRRTYSEIYYYKTKNGHEVDFIVLTENHSRRLIQVCEEFTNPQTRKREIQALVEAMSELNLNTGTIITRDEEQMIEIENKKIMVMPIWRFLLGDENIL